MIRRCNPDLTFETPFWQCGMSHVAGLDEAGRGAWAGPVAAGAVMLPSEPGISERLSGVRDSKQMTTKERTYWVEKITGEAVCWGVGMASNAEVDQLGILPATRLAMRRALAALTCAPEMLLVDAVRLPEVEVAQAAIIRGDSLSLSIAAASVLAKTARDQLMIEMDSSHPNYGFARHKGYGTALHRAALEYLGPCVLHRRSFAPIRDLQTLPG